MSANPCAEVSVAGRRRVAVDLFAGTGWGVACQRLGIDERGVEIMPAAVATRDANGMVTIFRDVWEGLDDPSLVPEHDMQIASPPCPTFSSAGKGEGRRAMPRLLRAIDERAYESVTALRELAAETDAESALVLVPLAYIWRFRPMYVALEQVREVLPLWRRYALELRTFGYSAWAGILHAERYGVPQARRRAVVMARRDGRAATAPRATHSRFYERDKTRLDPGVLPWVSMADALGWDVDRPAPTVTGGGTRTGGAEPFGRRGRAAIERARNGE